MNTPISAASANKMTDKITQLENRIKVLEKQNQELEAFAYVASHDLQEPLRKIHIFTERILEIEEDNFSEVSTDHFKRILSAAERMKKLINALLNYSRTSTDEKVFVKQNLNKIVEEVKQNLQESYVQKGAIIRSEELPTLHVIPHQFAQLLENLISNSLKYSHHERQPIIDIKARKIDRKEHPSLPDTNNEYWHFSIADNGIGFDDVYKERIFELFQRLHGKHEYEGTGIGLAVCRRIVENHGGIINARGIAGEGCTIHIFLPVSTS